MKIYLSNYRHHWYSPYKILEKVLFWKDWENINYDTPWVEKWADRIEPFSKVVQKILDTVHPKIDYVKIDRWDTWGMDHTLAKIILPMLKQLKETKHGSAYVDINDVPEELRGTSTPDYDAQLTFDFYNETDDDVDYELVHKRWDYVLNEMIFAFECKNNDSWDDQFWTGELGELTWEETGETMFNPITNKEEKTYQMLTSGNRTCDWEGRAAMQKRIDNGFRLFGKYYEGLWD